MTAVPAASLPFAQRLRSRERLFGTFVKIPTLHSTELLGGVGFDFVVIDQEHAPLDLAAIDVMILAARATGMAPLVRVSDASPGNILSVLDCGAAGVFVPHVDSAEKARAAAAACRYRGGKRGFARTGRAAGYGAVGFADHLSQQDENVLCIAMIEEPEGVERIDEIVAVPGIDAVFVGRADLSVSMGEASSASAPVKRAVEEIARGVVASGKPLLMLAENTDDQVAMTALGATAFMVGSDIGFLRKAALQAISAHAAI